MKTYFLSLPLLFSACFCFAQSPSERFAETIEAEDLKAHLYFLADDLLEGRATTKRGQKIAAAYIRSQFMRLGLPGGNQGEYFQTYYLKEVKVGGGSLTVAKEKFNYKDDFLPGLQATPPATLPTDLIFVGYGLSEEGYDNLAGLDLTGKTVIMLAGSPSAVAEPDNLYQKFRFWAQRAPELEARGASAVITVLSDQAYKIIKRFAGRSRTITSDSEDGGMGQVYVSEAVGEALLNAAKTSMAKVKAELETSASVPKLNFKKAKFTYSCDVDISSDPAENVLGFLEGTDKKDEIIVITSHYDHIGLTSKGEINNGADDDGSGTSTVLELAEAFTEAARRGYRPRRSILFMTVSGEEIGLLGSEFYANNPIFPIENTVANLNIDMIGRVDPKYIESADSANYVYIIGSDKLSSELHAISETANDTYTDIVLDYTYNDPNDPNRYYYRSDHYNFASKGIPVIFYFTGTHPDYHRPTDTIEKINYDKMAHIGKLVFHTAWELANREQRIKVDSNKK
ncbi:MAG: M28 family peptidase [Bacteroidota bacterium]